MTGARGLLTRTARGLRSPERTWLAVRMLCWAVVLPVLKRRVALDRLVRLMWRDPGPGVRDRNREEELRRLSRRVVAVRHGGDNCLERSLIAYRHLSGAGADPALVVGSRRTDAGLEGHVWVVVDGCAVHDSPQEVATYAPLAVFGRQGRLQAGVMASA